MTPPEKLGTVRSAGNRKRFPANHLNGPISNSALEVLSQWSLAARQADHHSRCRGHSSARHILKLCLVLAVPMIQASAYRVKLRYLDKL